MLKNEGTGKFGYFTSFATRDPMITEKEKLSGHPMFYEILDEMKQIHAAKNKDYGGGDPLGNFKTSAESLGISPFKGVLVRASDKWSRISNIVKSGETHVKDETIEDTLLDLSVYCILAIIVRRETETETQKRKPEVTKNVKTSVYCNLNDNEIDRSWFRSISNGVAKGKRHDSATWLISYLRKKHPGDILIQKATFEAWNNLNQPPLPNCELQAIFDEAGINHKKE